eukprot:5969069-Alexandrium_andersonii.AAC.1
MECPWRRHTCSPPKVYDNIRQLENSKRPRKRSLSEPSDAAPSPNPLEGPASAGASAGGPFGFDLPQSSWAFGDGG